MTQNRKRRRNMHEDEVEVELPLSKRINNLHIHNSMLLDNSSERTTSLNVVEWGPGPPNYVNQLPESPPSSEQSLDWNMAQFSVEYAPDLNENQNPHYFNINKLLFEMYLQRMQRGCHQI